MKEVSIYTDGACSGNPGPGGWAAVLVYNGHRKEISGRVEETTTNNRMELIAVIEALKALKEPCKVKVYSDSAYLINAFNQGWIEKWQKNGWLNSKKEKVENIDLWEALLELTSVHQVEWHKIRGHDGITLNELCDRLARGEIAEMKEKEKEKG